MLNEVLSQNQLAMDEVIYKLYIHTQTFEYLSMWDKLHFHIPIINVGQIPTFYNSNTKTKLGEINEES